ncbi:MAG: hypothetical protein R3Y61_02900 [Rikenellaceae bacterium]
MPYSTKITEQRPSIIVLMIDQSGSMNETYHSKSHSPLEHRTKAQMVAETSNIMLMDILARCRQGSTYKHYFDIAVIGYSGRGIYPLLPTGQWRLSPNSLARSVKETHRLLRKLKRANGKTVHHYSSLKVWIEPDADGDTPMGAALQKVSEILFSWRNEQKHNDFFPPTIINITDGEATDIIPSDIERIKSSFQSLGSSDGEPIIFNLHITNTESQKVCFPTKGDNLPPEARILFELSSALPEIYNDAIGSRSTQSETEGLPYRAFSYNLPLTELIGAIQIGTTTTQQIHL